MTQQHHDFVDHYLVHKNKEAAYAHAYPGSKQSSHQSAANRLLQRPEIKAYIDERRATITAAVNEELKQRQLKALLDLQEAKELLQSIIRGQHVTWRNAKVKGGFEKIEVYPTHAQILRALDMFLKLSDLYPKKERAKSGSAGAKEQAEEEEEFDNYWITIGDKPFDPVEGTKYAQWYPLYYAGILWNPTKPNERAGWQKYMNTLSEVERAPFVDNVRRWDENRDLTDLRGDPEKQQQFTTNYNNDSQHNQYGAVPNQGRHSEGAQRLVESGRHIDAATSEPLLSHTAASHQISPHALRNDGLDANPQQFTTNYNNSITPPLKGMADRPGDVHSRTAGNASTTSPANAQGHGTPPSKGGFAEQQQNTTTANCPPQTADCNTGYITLQQAFDIALENGKTDKTRKSLIQKNWLRIQMNREKPLTANQRKLLKEAGLEQHPTDKNLVRPCHASMNDPVVTVKYVGPPAYRWWER